MVGNSTEAAERSVKLCYQAHTAVMSSWICVCVFVYFLVWSPFSLHLSHLFLVFPDCLVSSLIGSPYCSVLCTCLFVFIVPRRILVTDFLVLPSSLSSFLPMSGDLSSGLFVDYSWFHFSPVQGTVIL
ncbi:hypothetical protein ILYODFUR_035233 [Ilyodon furcidens]|uniref:Uncharacterized protein n=1 Tax=Ilyodon furcidens TaxID=33524 RepID=A0ABV0U0D9_9TELE